MNKLLTIFLVVNINLAIAKKNPFSKFKDEISSLRTIYVLTDSTVVEDMKKKQIGINLDYNQKLSIEMFKQIKEIFAGSIDAQFIHVLGSVGMYQPDNIYIPDYNDYNHHINLPALNASIVFERKDEFVKEINPLIDRSYAQTRNRKALKQYKIDMLDKDFSRIQRLNLKDDEAILILTTTGIKIPTKKSIGQAVLTGILTLGMASGWQQSATQLNTVLISSEGTLLWAASVFKAGKPTKEKKQKRLITKIYKNFPMKLKRKI